ncbi:MAG: hypothetical protein Q9217_000050 [Psora testacea]
MPRRQTKEQVLKSTMRGVSASTEHDKSHYLRWISKGIGRKDKRQKRDKAMAHPSASILLISAQNRILLLHRVNTSTSFASAHVFPGGHVDAQDGDLPPLDDPRRHEDSEAYRVAAIRECFEESGLLLAKHSSNPDALIDLSELQRDAGRKAIHSQEISFLDWLKHNDATPDTEGLITFTRWLTPANLPKRYSTQMYIYFLPIDSFLGKVSQEKQMHIPTPDGGIEHTAAQFLYAKEWLDMALRKEIELFPPQFYLLSLIEPFLSSPPLDDQAVLDNAMLQDQRQRLRRWIETDGDPPWGEKCISPDAIKKKKNEYLIIGLAEAGPELEGTGRRGDEERVLRVELDREVERGRQRPRPVEVCWKRDLLREGRAKI